MKESATIAMEYLKSNAELYDLDPQIFQKWNVHIHVPEEQHQKMGLLLVSQYSQLLYQFLQRER